MHICTHTSPCPLTAPLPASASCSLDAVLRDNPFMPTSDGQDAMVSYYFYHALCDDTVPVREYEEVVEDDEGNVQKKTRAEIITELDDLRELGLHPDVERVLAARNIIVHGPAQAPTGGETLSTRCVCVCVCVTVCVCVIARACVCAWGGDVCVCVHDPKPLAPFFSSLILPVA